MQDDALEELTKEIDQMRGDIQRISAKKGSRNNQKVDDLKRKVASIQRQLTEIRKMVGIKSNMNEPQLTDQEMVQKWLNETIRLPQYFELFMEQGFEDLDSIKFMTKDDLKEIGVDNTDHQRRILKNAQSI